MLQINHELRKSLRSFKLKEMGTEIIRSIIRTQRKGNISFCEVTYKGL